MNKAMRSSLQNLEATVERDLRDALLNADSVNISHAEGVEPSVTIADNPDARIPYPWNPALADEFFAQQETQFDVFEDWDTEEVSTRSHQFFSHLDTLWSVASLQVSLAERFAMRLPQPVLSAIVHRAQAVASTSASLADKLVQCVQDLLPGLAELVEDDVYVLARPMAHAMRGSASIESTLAAVRPVDWEQLSETDQMRLSLAVARSALAELQTSNDYSAT